MQNGIQQTAADEINLKALIGFLKRNRKPIVLSGLAGLLLSVFYVTKTPKTYEAQWQVKMAQFADKNSEEPAALIQRLRSPSSYPVEVKRSCGINEDQEVGEYLNDMLKAEVIKNAAYAVEMKVRAASPELANKCAEAVTSMIVAQQQNIIEERMAGRQELKMLVQQTLQAELKDFEKIKIRESGTLGFLAKLERINTLKGRVDALQEEFLMAQKHPAMLLVPIAASSKPVSPRVGQKLLPGALLGLMLGVLYALGREGWCKTAKCDS